MISAAILADQYELDPPLVNMMTGLGIMLSFITVFAVEFSVVRMGQP